MVRFFTFTLLLLPSLPASAAEIAVARFGSEGISGWERKVFKGTTDYRLVQEDGRTVLRARARGAASGLTKKIKFNPAVHRYLRWSW
ncbi:MAG: DUF3047 domain-containing protein, partial [Desulfuromonadaceae bacterium]|nr:DUF3047 domain-containing protein [Desulfuromonadaceae bacterium]